MKTHKVDKETLAKWALDVDYLLEHEGIGAVENHARVSSGNHCQCGECFCCYCLEIVNNIKGAD